MAKPIDTLEKFEKTYASMIIDSASKAKLKGKIESLVKDGYITPDVYKQALERGAYFSGEVEAVIGLCRTRFLDELKKGEFKDKQIEEKELAEFKEFVYQQIASLDYEKQSLVVALFGNRVSQILKQVRGLEEEDIPYSAISSVFSPDRMAARLYLMREIEIYTNEDPEGFEEKLRKKVPIVARRVLEANKERIPETRYQDLIRRNNKLGKAFGRTLKQAARVLREKRDKGYDTEQLVQELFGVIREVGGGPELYLGPLEIMSVFDNLAPKIGRITQNRGMDKLETKEMLQQLSTKISNLYPPAPGAKKRHKKGRISTVFIDPAQKAAPKKATAPQPTQKKPVPKKKKVPPAPPKKTAKPAPKTGTEQEKPVEYQLDDVSEEKMFRMLSRYFETPGGERALEKAAQSYLEGEIKDILQGYLENEGSELATEAVEAWASKEMFEKFGKYLQQDIKNRGAVYKSFRRAIKGELKKGGSIYKALAAFGEGLVGELGEKMKKTGKKK